MVPPRCYTIADMPWYQKKAANVVLATMPETSYREALENFERGEIEEPMFYCWNLVMIAECQLKLGNREAALLVLRKAKRFPATDPDDVEAVGRAKELLLKNFGEK